jgi:CRP-like cAMP-binding protein
VRCQTDSACRTLQAWLMTKSQNQLIARLPVQARKSLLAVCDAVNLTVSKEISKAGGRVREVYFPLDGFVSLIAAVGDSPGVEVGMVGSEGLLGASLALGVTIHPVRAVVQGSGSALRVGASAFRDQLQRSPALEKEISRYLYVLMCQQAASAVCLRFHKIGPRLARWLLMSQDRAHSPDFHITHEFLSYMLGVRRVGITNAATLLQRAGLIDYQRGEIRVIDRAGLEAAACGCYAADRTVYDQVLG